MIYCVQCGKPNADTARFCIGCGGSLDRLSARPGRQTSKKGKWFIIGGIMLAGLLAASYFLFFKSGANKNEASPNSKTKAVIKDLVNKWNSGLNNRKASEVSALYAERIVYYRQPMSRGNAEVILNDFFQKNDNYAQQIAGEVNVEKNNDDLVVAAFDKSVLANGKATVYPSYLKFSKEGDNWKIVEEGDKVTDYNIQKQGETIKQLTIINDWIKKNIRSDIAVSQAVLKGSGISTNNYKSAGESMDTDNSYLDIGSIKPEISFENGWIRLQFTDEDNTINFFLGDKYIFRTWHLSMGSNGGSTSYDLVTKQNKQYDFTITDINSNIIKMYKDGYDFDKNGDPLGHYWQSGTYNITTGSTTWGAKEF